MYLLGKELFGEKGGLVAGVLFLFAPYRALDGYVRGAVAESFALSLIPLVFYFSLRLIRKGGKADFIGTVLSLLFFCFPIILCRLFFCLFFWLGFCWFFFLNNGRMLNH